MNEIITKNIDKLKTLFIKNKVKNAYIFGSVLNSNFDNNSDIDFIIDFETNLKPLERGEFYWLLYDDLKKLFKKEIDIINAEKLTNPYFIKEINQTKQLIYGG